MTTILIAAAGGFLAGIGCVGLVFWAIAESVGQAARDEADLDDHPTGV